MSFLRTRPLSLRQAAWVLKVSFSALSHWNQGFDEHMRAFRVPDARGKAATITVEMVRVIVRAAENLKTKGRRLRIQGFTTQLKTEHGIVLSKRKVREILIANGLFAARTRKRRPRFYRSLRKEIPNGLLSLDGSDLIVWLDGEPYKFNVELGVDVKTFAHTGFSVGDSETSDEVIQVLEAHRRDWGTPLGMLCDSGSSNLGVKTKDYLHMHGIELVPVGPSNPKGNGTDEGAFSQMKQLLGAIQLDVSSPRSLAKSVLEKLISLYITMRNRIPVRRTILTPLQGMSVPASTLQRDLERQRLKDYTGSNAKSEEDQGKLDQLHGLIRYHGIELEPAVVKQAERSIKAFDKDSISAAEEAFVRAVTRKPERRNLAYFFGILKRIQQEKDDEAYRTYCHERYNEQVMLQLQRQEQEPRQNDHSVEGIVRMLVKAVKTKVQFVKELAIRKARQWTQEVMVSYRYPGALKNRFAKALEALTDLNLDQRNKIWELIEQFLNPKTRVESVTRIS